MAVAFDNTASTSGSGVTSLTTPSFTIAGANRAAMLGLSQGGNGSTAFSGNCGNVAASLVSGTDTGAAVTTRSQIWQVIAPDTSTQTASMSWTTAQNAILGVVTATAVDQTTPVNNGTLVTNAGVNTSVSLTITSTSGDLTMDTVASNVAISAPTQTQEWNLGTAGAGSIGPGTGTTTHAWTLANGIRCSSGANFVLAQASITPTAGALTATGMASTVVRGTVLTPTAGVLALAGYVPGVMVPAPFPGQALWEPVWLVEIGAQ